MRIRAFAPLLVVTVLFSLLALPACRNDTWIELVVQVRQEQQPPDIYQLRVQLTRQSGGAPETLTFPERPGRPLDFPASVIILLPGEPDSLSVVITALGQDGQPLEEVPPVPSMSGLTVTPGDGESFDVILSVRRPMAEQYQPCDPNRVPGNRNADCPPGLACATVLGGEDHSFCTAINCIRDLGAKDPGTDPLCEDPAGGDGRCFDISTGEKAFLICLLTCQTSDDCPEGLTCDATLASQFGHGGCISSCDDDADCCAGKAPPCGFVCAEQDDGGRRCMADAMP